MRVKDDRIRSRQKTEKRPNQYWDDGNLWTVEVIQSISTKKCGLTDVIGYSVGFQKKLRRHRYVNFDDKNIHC